MVWNIQYLRIDFELEKFIPANDPDSQLYEAHKSEFGYDNDFLLLTISPTKGIFNQSFLAKVEAFETSLKNIDGINDVLSPLGQKQLINGPAGPITFPLIHLKDEKLLKQDSVNVFSHSLSSTFFSSDRKSYSIYLTHEHFLDQEKGVVLVDEIATLSKGVGIETLRMIGKLPAQNEFNALIKGDFGVYLLGSLLLSFTVLIFLFRDIRAATLPFLISFFTILWLFGLMGLLGVKINLLSSLLPPILLFVSMSDAVHLINAIQKSNADPKARLIDAVATIWTPTFLTSFTTAVGFLSLLWINTEPIQLLGLFAAIGIAMAFIVTFTLGLIMVGNKRPSSTHHSVQVPRVFLPFLLKNKKAFIMMLLLIILTCIPGIKNLKVDAYLLDDLPSSSLILADFAFADQHLGGSKPYELRIEAKNGLTVWDAEVMDEIDKITAYLANEYPIAGIGSPSIILSYLNQANHGGQLEHFTYPATKKDYQKAKRLLSKVASGEINRLVTKDEKACRIVGFIPEYGSGETKRRNEQLLQYLDQTIDQSKIAYYITGTTFLIDKSHELLSSNLIKGLLTAVLIIGIVLGVYFRSFRLLLISLIPNLIPLLMVAGIIGWMGIPLKMTTSIIFTIAFGIAVDDTIHMMSYFLKNKKKNASDKLKDTFHHAGSAMLITSIIVIAGFSLFLFSNFGATFYMGLFICLSLFIALLIDLTLLPLLLLKVGSKKNDVK